MPTFTAASWQSASKQPALIESGLTHIVSWAISDRVRQVSQIFS